MNFLKKKEFFSLLHSSILFIPTSPILWMTKEEQKINALLRVSKSILAEHAQASRASVSSVGCWVTLLPT